MAWLDIDKKGRAGFKHNNMRTRAFNVIAHMAETGCTPMQAMLAGLEWAVNDTDAEFLVVSTLSKLDKLFWLNNVARWKAHPNLKERDNGHWPNGEQLNDHATFSHACDMLGMHIIYLIHRRFFAADEAGKKQSTAITISSSSEVMVPAIRGQGGKFYTADATLQIVMHAFRDTTTRKIRRQAHIGYNAHGEGKNRYEGLLPDMQEPPNLRKLLKMAWGE